MAETVVDATRSNTANPSLLVSHFSPLPKDEVTSAIRVRASPRT